MMFRLWERIWDWIALFVLIGLSVVMMLAQNRPLMQGMRAAALEATSWVEGRFAWAGRYFRTLEENDLLRQENITLASEVARSREAIIENQRLRSLLAYRDSSAFPLEAARIISKDITGTDNLLTIDRGSQDSVRVGMAVIDDRGIIGRVVLTSPHYARVMPYLNTEFRVPAKVQPLEAAGIVSWEGNDRNRLLMEHVFKTEPVVPGQLVVSSGFSGVFPPGYPIGVVDSVATRPGRNELVIHLVPSASLSDAEHAFVILRAPEPEKETLEEQSIR